MHRRIEGTELDTDDWDNAVLIQRDQDEWVTVLRDEAPAVIELLTSWLRKG